MLYTSAVALVARFGDQVALMVGADPETAPVVVRAIQDATAEVDSYLQGRFTLPLASVPPILEQIASDVAVYRLLALRPQQEVEDARRRYEDALKRLQQIRDGRLDLGLPQAQTPASGPAPVLVTSATRLFSRSNLREA